MNLNRAEGSMPEKYVAANIITSLLVAGFLLSAGRSPNPLAVLITIPISNLFDLVFHGDMTKHAISMAVRLTIFMSIWYYHCHNSYESIAQCIDHMGDYTQFLCLGLLLVFALPFFIYILYLQVISKLD